MLRDKKNDLLHLLTLLESLEKITLYSQDAKDAESFLALNDQINFNAVLNLLVHVGETSSKLSDDLLDHSPEIEWHKIKALRNRIAHDYMGLNVLMVFRTIRNAVPQLTERLYYITRTRLSDGTLDGEELRVSQGSPYYRHIQFSKLATL
jgi:uncharacterized protein with HEPN domain